MIRFEYDRELLKPERGHTETLPWGVVRVAGRNRPDTVNNPSYYNVTYRLLCKSQIDWFGRWWRHSVQEGSLPFITNVGSGEVTAAVIADPSYSGNTGLKADVSMRLEVEEFNDYCSDLGLIAVGQEFGDQFPLVARTLETALNG